MGSSDPLFISPLLRGRILFLDTLLASGVTRERIPQELPHCPKFPPSQQVHMQVGDVLS